MMNGGIVQAAGFASLGSAPPSRGFPTGHVPLDAPYSLAHTLV